MIGASKTQTAGKVSIPLNYRVDLNPGMLMVLSQNGSATSASCFSTVIDGIGPFTYLWAIDNPVINITKDTSSDTKFQTSGFNTRITGVATLTVTDTGNSDTETSETLNVTFDFEP